MRQLYFIGQNRFEWREIPEPKLESEVDALVRPIAVARCDLDLSLAAFLGSSGEPFPFGHEFVAEITQIGSEVRNFKVGQKVIIPFQVSCGACRNCNRHLSGQCQIDPHHAFFGLGPQSQKWGGAFSDLVRIPYADHMLVAIPQGIPAEHLASASDNLVDAWRSVGPYLQADPLQSVRIVGGGARSIGLYAVLIAKALGAPRISYIDKNAERLELAEQFGAQVEALETFPEKPSTKERFSITVDASAKPQGLNFAIKSTEPGGVCTSIGIYPNGLPIPFLDLYLKSIQFKTGLVNSRDDLPQVLKLVEAGKLHPEKVTTQIAKWEDAAEALLSKTTKLVVLRD